MTFFIKALLLNKINSIFAMFIFMSYAEVNTVSECNVSSWKKKIPQVCDFRLATAHRLFVLPRWIEPVA